MRAAPSPIELNAAVVLSTSPKRPVNIVPAPMTSNTSPMTARHTAPAARLDRVLPHGGHRRDPRGVEGGSQRRHDGDHYADDQGDDHGPRLDDQATGGQGDPEGVEGGTQRHGQPGAHDDADQRGDGPDDQRLDQHRPDNLAPGQADRPHQRQLAGPLGDDDLEGVVDDEGADEEGDESEDEKEGVEEGERLLNSAACSSAADWAVCALALSGRTSPMRLVRSAASVPVGEHPGPGHHALLAEHRLGSGEVEEGQGRPTEIVGFAERHDPRQGEVGHRDGLAHDRNRVTDGVAAGLGGAGVDRHLVAAGGGPPSRITIPPAPARSSGR